MNINLINISDNIKNPSCITPWSFIHLHSGFIFYLTLKYLYPKFSFFTIFIFWLILHTIYEIKDLMSYFNIYIYKSDYNSIKNWNNNSIINSIFDTIFTLIGLLIAYYININSNNFYFVNMIIYILTLYYFFTNKKIG